MKKKIFYLLIANVLMFGMLSCGKATRGKMINNWNVDSFNREYTSLDNDGSKSVSIETISGNVQVKKTIDYPENGGAPQTDIQTGTVNENSWVIKKDGTWISIKDIFYGESGAVTRIVAEQTGTWSFIQKSKEDGFKRNERVVFHVLSSKTTNTYMNQGSVIGTSFSNLSYSAGDRLMIFTIKKSKGKLLEMESEIDYSVSDSENNNQQTSGKTSITLK